MRLDNHILTPDVLIKPTNDYLVYSLLTVWGFTVVFTEVTAPWFCCTGSGWRTVNIKPNTTV